MSRGWCRAPWSSRSAALDEGLGKKMKIASWNVNSIKARLDHVTAWLQERGPDVLLMQELKRTEFPSRAFSRRLGYHSVVVTQKAYNGVAILSRLPIESISTSLAGR